jgi:hypothetical protein
VSRVTRHWVWIDNWIYWTLMTPQLQRTTTLYNLYKALQNTLSPLSLFCLWLRNMTSSTSKHITEQYTIYCFQFKACQYQNRLLQTAAAPRSLSPCCGVLEHLVMHIALWIGLVVIPGAPAGDEACIWGFGAQNFVKIAGRGLWFTYEIVQIHKMTIAGKWFITEVNLLPHSLSTFHYILVIQALIYHCLITGSLGTQSSQSRGRPYSILPAFVACRI